MNNTPKNALTFIFFTLLIDIMGWGIIIPVLPKLIEELIHGDISQASQYGGWLLFTYAFTQLVFAPLIGNLSDKYGRRPIILLSLIGFSIDYIFLAMAPTIFWLFIGRIIAGITGASLTTANAYIADVSTKETRVKNFGLVGAAFGLGFIIGPVLGGFLGQYGTRIPFYAAAILCFINFIYGYFILPESLDKSRRKPFQFKNVNPLGGFMLVKKYPKTIKLFWVFIIFHVASHAINTNWSYYNIYKFNWSEKEIGLSLGLTGLLASISQGFLIRKIHPRLRTKNTIYLGFSLFIISSLLFAFAFKSWMMYAILIPYGLGSFFYPVMQSEVTSNISEKEQGELQGIITSIMSLGAIIGPVLMTNTFYFFTHNNAPFIFAGMPFILASILLLIAFFLIKRYFDNQSKIL